MNNELELLKRTITTEDLQELELVKKCCLQT